MKIYIFVKIPYEGLINMTETPLMTQYIFCTYTYLTPGLYWINSGLVYNGADTGADTGAIKNLDWDLVLMNSDEILLQIKSG